MFGFMRVNGLLFCAAMVVAGCGGNIGGVIDSGGNGGGDGGNGGGDGGDEFGDGGGMVRCGELPVTIRDFRESHPDFETYSGSTAFTGLVENMLDGNKKPVYAPNGSTAQTTGQTEFDQWYRDVPGVNETFPITIMLTETSPGLFTFNDSAFFPIDGRGFGNEGNANNFHFTTELHTSFVYQGGEIFTFTGDDDFWLFVNGRLAVDLGGLHSSLSDTLDLDAAATQLGLTVGNRYDLDIFHAERHTSASNFRIETTIDCFIVQ